MPTDLTEPATLVAPAPDPPVASADHSAGIEASSSSMPLAIVIGCGVTALGALRSLGRAGIPVALLPEIRDVACRSRWARPLPGPFSSLPPNLPLSEVLDRSGVERAVLIACSDSSARRVSALPPELRDRFRSTVPPLETLEIFVDKRRFAAFLNDHGLPHPITVEVERAQDLDPVDDRLFESAFLKPRDSQRFFAQYGVKGCPVRDREHAVTMLERFHAKGLSMVLQEYVPGPPTSHVFLDGFVDRRGRITHLLSRRRIRMYPGDFGNSTVCETVAYETVRPAIEELCRLLRCSGYRGIFSAEVKQDARDGVYRFLEINARAWWYAGFAAECGVNVCEAAYRDALGLEVRPAPEPRPGLRLVYPSQDFAAFRREYGQRTESRSAPSTGQWYRAWAGARQPIWSSHDPGPAVWAARRWVLEKFGRTLDA